MFSGKSTELIRRLRRYQIARYQCLIVKYARDTRYSDDGIATHDRSSLQAVGATELKELTEAARSADVIGIDEGQFVSFMKLEHRSRPCDADFPLLTLLPLQFSDVVTFCEDMANSGKTVVVAALDGTFQRKGFQSILELIPLAESVVKLTAVCMSCFGEGSYTKRISEDTEVHVTCYYSMSLV